ELDRPVGVVEELLPAGVALVGQADVDDRAAARAVGFGDQVHAGLIGGPAAFLDVAADAAADDVVPSGPATLAFWDDMVQAELAGVEALAAILAAVGVARINVAAVELYVLPRQLVVTQQADDPRHGDLEADGMDPVKPVRLEVGFQLRQFL